MHLRITARPVELQGSQRADLEDRIRLLLGSWTCRIRRAWVCVENGSGRPGGLDVHCSITASMIPSGKVAVHALGTDTETAMRGAARRLVRSLKGEFSRRRPDVREGKRMVG